MMFGLATSRLVRLGAAAVAAVASSAVLCGSPSSASTTCLGRTVTINMNQVGHPNPNRSNSDVILGTSGDDFIYAGGGDDFICPGAGRDGVNGGSGNDWIVGVPDGDSLVGGDGTDWIDYRNAAETLDISLLDGQACVIFHGSDSDVCTVVDHISGFENAVGGSADDSIESPNVVGKTFILYGMGGSDHLSGSSGNDRLVGGTGDDTIRGGGGNDYLRGDTGANTYIGEAGVDTVDYSRSASPVVVNLRTTAAQATGDSASSFVDGDVENVIGSRFGDQLRGTAAGDVMQGGPGNDVIYGYEGNDKLYGSDGNDTLHGGLNTDVCTGNAGTDASDSCETTYTIP